METKDLLDVLTSYYKSKRCVSKYSKQDIPKFLMEKMRRLERLARNRAEQALDEYVRQQVNKRIHEIFGDEK